MSAATAGVPKGDPWRVLGLEPGADARTVKSAYRRLARQHHPDTNPGNAEAAEMFLLVCEAYQALTGPEEPSAAPSAPRSQDDLPTPKIRVTFLQAYQGGEVDVEIPIAVTCRRCQGQGCGFCYQSGQVVEGQRFLVSVPAGVFDGMPLRAQEHKGQTVLMVTAEVAPSPVFERVKGRPQDVLLELPVTVTEAVLGATVRLPTPKEIVNLKIPPGTEDGKVFRLSGSGFPRLDGQGVGDLIIKVKVDVPKALSPPQRKMYEELARYESDPRLLLLKGS